MKHKVHAIDELLRGGGLPPRGMGAGRLATPPPQRGGLPSPKLRRGVSVGDVVDVLRPGRNRPPWCDQEKLPAGSAFMVRFALSEWLNTVEGRFLEMCGDDPRDVVARLNQQMAQRAVEDGLSLYDHSIPLEWYKGVVSEYIVEGEHDQ